MKIAIVHDHFLYFGGAERVAIALLRMFPCADIYTAFADSEAKQMIRNITAGKLVVSPFDRIPLVHSVPEFFKPLISLWWERLNFSGYDVVISSSHSYSAKSVIVPRHTVHISYIHSPPRFLYGIYNQSWWIHRPIILLVSAPLFLWMRRHDQRAAQRPAILVANSQTVQARIKKYYHRNSTVIYPPVLIPKTMIKKTPQYYLCLSHLLKQKGIDLAIRACNAMKVPLVIAGAGPEEMRLKKIAGPTITFLGRVPDKQIDMVYAGAIALLYPSVDEDFGIVPVEAMAHGVPVVAYASGGTKETVIDGETGVLFTEFSVHAMIRAIHRLSGLSVSPRALRSRARKFSEINFLRRMQELVRDHSPVAVRRRRYMGISTK